MELVKYINEEGEAGLVYSPCYGIEWVRFGNNKSEYAKLLMYDEVLVKAVLDEDNDAFKDRAKAICEEYNVEVYIQNVRNLSVYFIPEGRAFKIESHDGYERIEEIYEEIFVA